MATSRIAFALGIALLAGGTLATADGPATSRPAATGPATTRAAADPAVAELVRQLDADDPAARDAAADGLVARGEAARPAVAAAAADPASPEQRARTANVIARLDRAVAERPTTVTLHAAGTNPRDLFLAVAKQGGVDVAFMPDVLWTPNFGPPPPGLTVDFADRPFWEAMDDLCRQAKVDLRSDLPGPGLTVVPGSGLGLLNGPRCDAGRLTVVAQSYDRGRSVVYAGGGQQAGSDQVQLLALLDPKLSVADGTTPEVTVTEAADEQGKSMAGPATHQAANAAGRRRARLPFGFPSGRPVGLVERLSAVLQPPTVGATTLRTLKGTVSMEVVDRTDRQVIDDAAHAGRVVRQVGGCTVELERCDAGDRRVSYQINVRPTDPGKADLGPPAVRVEDAAGDPVAALNSGSIRTMPSGNGQATLAADLVTRGPIRLPVRLVLTVPTNTKAMTFPFEFHDLAMPKP